MSEAFEVIKAIEFGYQYQVNCELTPEQSKRILDWIEKWHKCQSLACKQEARIAELEETNYLVQGHNDYLREEIQEYKNLIEDWALIESYEPTRIAMLESIGKLNPYDDPMIEVKDE